MFVAGLRTGGQTDGRTKSSFDMVSPYIQIIDVLYLVYPQPRHGKYIQINPDFGGGVTPLNQPHVSRIVY